MGLPTTETEMEAFFSYLMWAMEMGLEYDLPVTLSFGLAIFVPFWAMYGFLHALCVAFTAMWEA
jgi:hypothetical protein